MKKRTEIPESVRNYFGKLGRQYGHLGGKKAAANMTKEARIARAKKASDAAQAKRKGTK